MVRYDKLVWTFLVMSVLENFVLVGLRCARMFGREFILPYDNRALGWTESDHRDSDEPNSLSRKTIGQSCTVGLVQFIVQSVRVDFPFSRCCGGGQAACALLTRTKSRLIAHILPITIMRELKAPLPLKPESQTGGLINGVVAPNCMFR